MSLVVGPTKKKKKMWSVECGMSKLWIARYRGAATSGDGPTVAEKCNAGFKSLPQHVSLPHPKVQVLLY